MSAAKPRMPGAIISAVGVAAPRMTARWIALMSIAW